jgi:hypothetical protein
MDPYQLVAGMSIVAVLAVLACAFSSAIQFRHLGCFCQFLLIGAAVGCIAGVLLKRTVTV